MNPRDWVEIEVAGLRFRTRRERTLLADSIIEKVFSKGQGLGASDIIKADCEIFDMGSKEWRPVLDSDLEKIGRYEGREILYNKIIELRKAEKDFRKVQQKKQKG